MNPATNDPTTAESDPLRVLLVAPTGRDAALACRVLTDRGAFDCLPCASMDQLCAELVGGGAGAVVVADEALNSNSLRRLLGVLSAQPAWSDLPVVVMTTTHHTDPQVQELVTRLRASANVTLLERPVRILTLVSAVEAALRGRRRQYQVRVLMREQEQAVRHRDQSLAMLGHERRNPLATITNALELVQNEPAMNNLPEAEEAGQIIGRQTRHLARLVDDLLDVSRITSGKIVLRMTHVDLAELARNAVRAIETWAANQRHKLHLDLPDPGSPPVIVN